MRYPNGANTKKHMSYSNRGMGLEYDLNVTNEYYLVNNIAVIYKKPTPITVSKVDYKLKIAKITEGYFDTPSTTDYNGLYKGKYIDFEAKETKLDYLPLQNIHKHQIEHLRRVSLHGGIGFIVVRFIKYDETYLLKTEDFINFIDHEDRKSIPIDYFKRCGYLIETKYNPRLDYLSIVETFIKEKWYEKIYYWQQRKCYDCIC